ncbi:MAG: type II secretion system protein, partial [Microgenomates group bacterium]
MKKISTWFRKKVLGDSRFRTSRQSGFSLLELLVVISIIAILVAMGVAGFTTAQRKARDARRSGDLKAIQT